MSLTSIFENLINNHPVASYSKSRLLKFIRCLLLFFQHKFVTNRSNFLISFFELEKESLCFVSILDIVSVEFEEWNILLNNIPVSLIFMVFLKSSGEFLLKITVKS